MGTNCEDRVAGPGPTTTVAAHGVGDRCCRAAIYFDRDWRKDDKPRTRSIALLAGHLGDMAFLRADYTLGDHRLTPEEID
jgi:hypothetical protein